MIAQIENIHDKLHREAIETAPVMESTPPEFFIKAAGLIVATVIISLIVRKLLKGRNK